MSQIKKAFKSRFKDGFIVEADLSQIEIVVLGFLSQDEQLLQDIRDGVDFHCKRLAQKLGQSYEHVLWKCKTEKDPWYDAQRTIAKQFSFQRSYGAGAPAIADSIGAPVEDIKELIRAEEQMYPGVVQMQEAWIQEVQSKRKPSKQRTQKGKPVGIGSMVGVLGSRYVFVEEDAPEWLQQRGTDISFRPTQIKNYQVQGFAGEVLKLILGRLYREFKTRTHFDASTLLVNTVHDSVLVDTVPENLEEVCKLLKETMESVPKLIQQYYGIHFNVPVKCDIEYGNNWGEKEEWKS